MWIHLSIFSDRYGFFRFRWMKLVLLAKIVIMAKRKEDKGKL